MIANKEKLVEGGKNGSEKRRIERRKDKGLNRTGNPLDLE